MVASLLIVQGALQRTTGAMSRQTHIDGAKANHELMNRHIPDDTPPEDRRDWRAYEEEQRKLAWRSCNWCGGKLMIYTKDNHPECDKQLDFMEEVRNEMRQLTPIGKLMLKVLHEAGFRLAEDEIGCKSILRDAK